MPSPSSGDPRGATSASTPASASGRRSSTTSSCSRAWTSSWPSGGRCSSVPPASASSADSSATRGRHRAGARRASPPPSSRSSAARRSFASTTFASTSRRSRRCVRMVREVSEVVIEVRGLELLGFHGALEEEQRAGQRFVFDVRLIAHDAGVRSDQLADTVDYTAVVEPDPRDQRGHAFQPDRGARGGDRRRPDRALSRLAGARARAQARGPARGARSSTRRPRSIARAVDAGLRRASARISAIGRTRSAGPSSSSAPTRGSSWSRSRPFARPSRSATSEQPPFLNGAVAVETELAPGDLLGCLLAVERELGRVRGEGPRFGPRTIDLDLLLYGDRVVDEPGLSIPHPRLAERRFALEPLHELDPLLALPSGRRVADLLAE